MTRLARRLLGATGVVAVLVMSSCMVTPSDGSWLEGTVPLSFDSPPLGYSYDQPRAVVLSSSAVESLYGDTYSQDPSIFEPNARYLFVWTGQRGVAGPVNKSFGALDVEVASYTLSCAEPSPYGAFVLPWSSRNSAPALNITTITLDCPP